MDALRAGTASERVISRRTGRRASLSEVFYRQTGDPLEQSTLGVGLGRRAARGAVSTVLTQWTQYVLQTGSTVVLARLLTPSDYGLVAMVTALIGIGDAFWNLGLQTATIRHKNINHAQVNVFFWLQAALGAALTLTAIGCAHFIATFYSNPKLFLVTIAYAPYFLVSGLLAQHLALLARQMRFTYLALTDVFAMAVGLGAAIVIAALGGGYWAIVVSALITLLVRLALYWWASGWVPTRPRRAAGVAPMLRFGLSLASTSLLGYLGQNADNVLIGRVYGQAPLGIYSRAYNLLLLPVRQIQSPMSRVAVPVLSYLQDQPERYRRYYHAAAGALCYVAMPAMAILAALAPDAVGILLGGQWHEAAPIFRVLAIAGVLQILRGPNSWVFTSTGHTGRQATWAALSQPILIGSFFVGIRWGIVGVSWAYTISTLVVLVPAFIWAVRDTPLSLRDVWGAGWRPGALSLIAFAAAFPVGNATRSHGHLAAAGAGGLAAGAALVASYLVWPSVRRELRGLRSAFASKTPQTAPPATVGAGATSESPGGE